MDLASAEDSEIVRMVCVLAGAVICLSICFRFVLDHALTKVTNSVTGGLILIENCDSIVDDLDRLNINQRAFLSTGDDRYLEDIAESVIGISSNLESLRQISPKGEQLGRRIVTLSRKVDWALDAVEKSFEMQQTAGSTVAIALLDNDYAAADAKMEALSLKKVATDGMFDRVQNERKMGSILQVLF